MKNMTKLKEEEAKNIYALLRTTGSAFEKIGGMVALTDMVRDDMVDYLKFACKLAAKANQEDDEPCEELAKAIKTAQALILKISTK